MTDEPFAMPPGARPALSVGELNRTVGRLLERSFPLVRVRGEVSNLSRAASGHWYFVLKDDSAQVRCAMFRGRAQFADATLRDGDAVEVDAQVRLYEPRGDYQLVVDAVRRAGTGGLLEAFQRLRERLAREGLFDDARKRPVPTFARRVGIVTSPDAAALRDVARALSEHAPYVEAIVYPTPVQGNDAPERIAHAIALANRRAEVDVLIVCRGGGSLEDLWAFNDERVARAIAASALPVVVGVGHESDTTMADFVADVRAPTPTAAARLAVAPRAQWLSRIEASTRALMRAARAGWDRAAMRVDYAQAKLVSPAQRLAQWFERLGHATTALRSQLAARLARDERAAAALRLRLSQRRVDLTALHRAVDLADQRLRAATQADWRQAAERVERLAQVVRALSPVATLDRGYAAVVRGDQFVMRARGLASGDRVQLRFVDGAADATIQTVATHGDNADDAVRRR